MKCCVKDCNNDSKDGEFVGTVCYPCYEFLKTMKPNKSQACTNFGMTRIWIYVEGGVIQNIVADKSVKAMVLDGDVEGIDWFEEYKDCNGQKFDAREAWDDVIVDKIIVDHYFSQRRKK